MIDFDYVFIFCLFERMANENKIWSIQHLRGLAALSVVLCHYGSYLSAHPVLSHLFSFGLYGVYVFFLITGFIIVYSMEKSGYQPKDFLKYLLKRSIRIDPSYYVIIILTFILFKVLAHIPGYRGEHIALIPGQLLAHIFYVVPFTAYKFYNAVFWTLCIEFQFYLLIGLFYFVSDSVVYKRMFLLLFALTCFIPFNNSYFILPTYAPMFAAGISLMSVYRKKTWSNEFFVVIFLALVAYKFGTIVFALLLLSSMVIIFFNQLIKPLAFLGDISYSLYLTHPLVAIVILGSLKKLNVNTDDNQLLWLAFKVCDAILIAYIFNILVEKPTLKLSKKITYANKSGVSQSEPINI